MELAIDEGGEGLWTCAAGFYGRLHDAVRDKEFWGDKSSLCIYVEADLAASRMILAMQQQI